MKVLFTFDHSKVDSLPAFNMDKEFYKRHELLILRLIFSKNISGLSYGIEGDKSFELHIMRIMDNEPNILVAQTLQSRERCIYPSA